MENRLKSLELTGYKTFANKTLFEFSGDITAVVGPNGSGKSNIADALRWVLGEQSYRLLRGRKTDDMIFSGSETKARAGMASATVTFDNSDGWLPIDFSEVSVTRRAYRDGQNEYLLNNQRVRLRDVSELLVNSGLAERTYTVIGQGLIDDALTLKADERRRLFEEAAGIGLYRNRKDQALRRLDNTKRNLERVQDILAELTPRLRSLQRQAQRTIEYDQVRTDLREVLRDWYGYHWNQEQEKLREAREIADQNEKTLESARKNAQNIEDSIINVRTRIANLRSQLNSWHRQLAQIHSEREETSRDLAVNEERNRYLQDQLHLQQTEINRLEEELAFQQTRRDSAQTQWNQVNLEVNEAVQQLDLVHRSLEEGRDQRQKLKELIELIESKINALKASQIELQARRTELLGRIQRGEEDLQNLAGKLAVSQQEALNAEESLGRVEAKQKEKEITLQEQNANLDQKESELKDLQLERIQLQDKYGKTSVELTRLKTEHSILLKAEEELAGFAAGTKTLLEAAKSGKLIGAKGALGNQLRLAPEHEVAVAAALGDYLDAVLLEGGETDDALGLLETITGKAAILPLNEIVAQEPVSDPHEDGCLGVGADLVECSQSLRPVIDMLLGQVLIVSDRTVARRVLNGNNSNLRAVTLRGEVFHGHGAILVDSGVKASTLRRPREREELVEQIAAIETALSGIEGNLHTLDEKEILLKKELAIIENDIKIADGELTVIFSDYQSALIDLQNIQNQTAWLSEQQGGIKQQQSEGNETVVVLESKLDSSNDELESLEVDYKEKRKKFNLLSIEDQLEQEAHWERQLAVNQQALDSIQKVKEERGADYNQMNTRLDQQNSRRDELASQIETLTSSIGGMRSSEGGIGERIAELQLLIDPSEDELRKTESDLEELLVQEKEERHALQVAERYSTQSQISLARKQETMDTLRQRIEADFGLVEFEYSADVSGPTPLPFMEMVEHLPVVKEVSPDLEETMKRQRMQLRRMGSINPEAQQEYNEVRERHDFLSSQMEDLQAAEADIREVIAELDVLMEREFRKTFDVVAVEFKEIFTRLFGGGSAQLVLIEGEDISEVGIDIEARLPGKRPQQLALLSGGERSLTAAALIFSLIKASPTPFCVMDEVDAMLDEANVGRFRDVLTELCEETQFVVITHNRHTVQAADVIYGITMGRDTTSQIISLKLEEVDGRYSSK